MQIACTAGDKTPPASAQPTLPGGATIYDFCGSDAEQRIRGAHPELPPCGDRRYVYLEARVAGQMLLALAHDADPCCTDVGAPGMDLGAYVYLDGQAWPASDPITLSSPPASAAEASPWLHAELLRLRVVQPTVDAAAVRAAWPATGPALAKLTLGLKPTTDGWLLRAVATSTEKERGVHCRSLAVWEATLSGLRARATRVALHSEGSVHGQPCQGDPLPR